MDGASPTGTDELATAIGRLTIEFGRLQKYLEFGVWLLVGAEQEIGQAITAPLSLRHLLDVFSSLYRLRFDSSQQLATLDSLLHHLSAAEERRNAITHSFWFPDVDGTNQSLRTRSRRKGFESVFKSVPTQQVHDEARSLVALEDQLMGFLINTQGMPTPGFLHRGVQDSP